MNATSTHDTKRAEDVRARISVLSEIPELWSREVRKWSRTNAELKRNGAPDANEELMIYQTLIGMWPLEESERESVAERLRQFLEKAAREAKTHSTWLDPDAHYEKALQDFATAILEHPPFIDSFRRFHKRIAFHGMLNSLAQVVLKATSPGVPDFYQGTELWDFSLVDPDNRRPVDYERRTSALRKMPPVATLMKNWTDGRIKLFTTARTLAARARNRDAFLDGDYRPIETGTPHAVAFTRGSGAVLVVVPRLTASLVKPGQWPVGEIWGEHALQVEGRWRNVFTDEIVESAALRNVFASFSVAVLERA